jgi:GDP-4-dehydro-6-deoxy-D-mannose reductase
MTDPKRILVTGATGFVGQTLIPKLRDTFPTSTLIACSNDSAVNYADITLPLDLVDSVSIEQCIETAQPDVIIHLAAETVVSDSFTRPLRTWRINVDGTLLLAEAVMRLVPHTLLIFASSAEIYGLTFQRGTPLDEDAPFAPANPYASSKAATDIALGEMALRGLNVVRLRPFNHTGPNQSDAFVVPSFAKQIAMIEAGLQAPLLKTGALDRWRDFLDVKDVCSAYILAIQQRTTLPQGAAINIASGTPKRIGDILQSLIDRTNIIFEIQADMARLRPTDVQTSSGNITRASTLLGWSPQISWEKTLDEVLSYWRDKVKYL